MPKTSYSKLLALALMVGALVAGAAIEDALSTHSLAPIWMVGWLPAVLVGAFSRRASGARCSPRVRRRARS